MFCSTQILNNSQDKVDLSKTDDQSNHSKTPSTKLDNTTSIESDNENAASLKNEEFEFFSDIVYDSEDLEKCLLTELLEALDGDNTYTENSEKNCPVEKKEVKENKENEKTIVLNVNEPSFLPKKFLRTEKKIEESKKENEKDLVLIKKNYPKKETKKNQKKKKSQFNEREGDWCCYKCKNINFSFRNYCNRCKLNRKLSDKMAEEALDKVMEYFKIKN